MYLKHFSAAEVRLSQADAAAIFRFFWPGRELPQTELTIEDRAFAQALLVEALDKTYDMGFVELIFRNFYGKVPTSFGEIRSIVKSFAMAAAKHWFRHATGKDLADPKIYMSIQMTLANNFRCVWDLRIATGEMTY